MDLVGTARGNFAETGRLFPQPSTHAGTHPLGSVQSLQHFTDQEIFFQSFSNLLTIFRPKFQGLLSIRIRSIQPYFYAKNSSFEKNNTP